MEQTSNYQNFTIPIHLHKTTTTLRNPYMMTERDLTSELRFVYSLTSQPSPKSHTLQFCSLSISQRSPLAFDASFSRHSETLQTWNSCSDEDKTCAFPLVFSAISLSLTHSFPRSTRNSLNRGSSAGVYCRHWFGSPWFEHTGTAPPS